MSKAKPLQPMGMDDYEAQADVDALQRAHQVKTDKKRHARAQAHAKKRLKEQGDKMQALQAVAGKATKKAAKTFNKGSYADLPYAAE